jgi:CheY-like chemotaxis protein
VQRRLTGFIVTVFRGVLSVSARSGRSQLVFVLPRSSAGSKTVLQRLVWCNVQLSTQGKVLIVDDESSLRRVLRVSLAALGFEAEEASTGEEALALLGANHYDVVLLDIEMPGIGGIETCKEIKRLFPQPIVLMLTVRDGKEDKVTALEAGADDYLTKPFRLPDLVARVRTALGNSRRESRARNPRECRE